ncbi:MAG: 2-dehydro-3-deoxygalactonokinase [Pseudomonadota bacterium]
MSTPFIAVDWGTTHLRAYRIGADLGRLSSIDQIEQRRGPGVTAVASNAFATTLRATIDDWLDADQPLPVLLSGMVTSTLGWHEVPYVDCPADIDALVATSHTLPFDTTDVTLIGGARCTNPLALPDVLRGEELQVLGVTTADEESLVIVPGTHNKWVAVRHGRIVSFVTVMTGELYALLTRYSVLVANDAEQSDDEAAFDAGLDAVATAGIDNALALLFSTRSCQLSGELQKTSAAAYLSGLVIGTDVRLGLRLAERSNWPTINLRVVAEPTLAERYVRALRHAGVDATTVPAWRASLAGLRRFLDACNKS